MTSKDCWLLGGIDAWVALGGNGSAFVKEVHPLEDYSWRCGGYIGTTLFVLDGGTMGRRRSHSRGGSLFISAMVRT